MALDAEIAAGAAGALLVGGPTVLAFFSGGFFDRPRIVAAIVAWALVIVATLLVARPLPGGFAGRLTLAALALLTGWTALSIAWAPIGERARTTCSGSCSTSASSSRRSPCCAGHEPGAGWSRRWSWGRSSWSRYGLSERLLPGWSSSTAASPRPAGSSSRSPTGTRFGLLAAIGLVLAVRVAGDPSARAPLRGGAAAAGVALGLGVYLTFARGALAAVATGLLVLIALAPTGATSCGAPSWSPAPRPGRAGRQPLPDRQIARDGRQGDAGEGRGC